MRYFQFANCSHSLQAQGEVDNIFCAGEKGGAMVGHTEAVVTGTLAGCNAVRHAAGKELPLEELEEILGAEEQNYREIELRETLMRALSSDEFDITLALLEGCSQREIARTLGVSQQAVAARLKTIRRKIKKALNE